MTLAAQQCAACAVLLTAQGSKPLQSIGTSGIVRREFDKTTRGYVLAMEPSPAGPARVTVPKQSRGSATPPSGGRLLLHPVVMLQLCLTTEHVAIEVVVVDGGGRRRLYYSTAHAKSQVTPQHAKLRVEGIGKGRWVILTLDVRAAYYAAYESGGPMGYRGIERLEVSMQGYLRRILALAVAPQSPDDVPPSEAISGVECDYLFLSHDGPPPLPSSRTPPQGHTGGGGGPSARGRSASSAGRPPPSPPPRAVTPIAQVFLAPQPTPVGQTPKVTSPAVGPTNATPTVAPPSRVDGWRGNHTGSAPVRTPPPVQSTPAATTSRVRSASVGDSEHPPHARDVMLPKCDMPTCHHDIPPPCTPPSKAPLPSCEAAPSLAHEAPPSQREAPPSSRENSPIGPQALLWASRFSDPCESDACPTHADGSVHASEDAAGLNEDDGLVHEDHDDDEKPFVVHVVQATAPTDSPPPSLGARPQPPPALVFGSVHIGPAHRYSGGDDVVDSCSDGDGAGLERTVTDGSDVDGATTALKDVNGVLCFDTSGTPRETALADGSATPSPSLTPQLVARVLREVGGDSKTSVGASSLQSSRYVYDNVVGCYFDRAEGRFVVPREAEAFD